MARYKKIHGNRGNGRINGFRNLTNIGQEEVILWKDSKMNLYKIKGGDTNKSKDVLMMKVISEENISSLQDLMIDKDNICEEKRPNKMLEQLV